VGIGVVVILLSTVVEHVPGNFLEVTKKTANLLTVPIALLFIFAFFVPFANPAGVWIGWFAAFATAVLIAFGGDIFGRHPETDLAPVSFQWIAPGALSVGLVTGLIACKLFQRKVKA